MTNLFSGVLRSSMTPKEHKWLYRAFIVIGLVFLFIGIPKHMKLVFLKRDCTADSVAVVQRIEKDHLSRGRHGSHTVYRGVLEMPPEVGARDNIAITPWSDVKFTESEVLEVKYDPSDPSRIYVNSRPPYDDGMRNIVTSAEFAAVSAICFISYKLRKDK